jgi:tetratricopeptide (TPR) repeat protein
MIRFARCTLRPAAVGLVLFGSAGAAPEPREVDALIREGLAAEAQLEPAKALTFFLQADAMRPNDSFILQKISRQYSDQTGSAAAVAQKAALARTALEYAERAFRLEPRSAVNALSLAICHGKLGLYGDARTKVEKSRLIHQYALEALELEPEYDWAHHVLGRWHYEVAELGAAKRFLVRMIYGALPGASLASAVTHLERAVALAPDTLAHHIELGFAYLAAQRVAEGRAALERGLALPSREFHDEATKVRAREALRQLEAGGAPHRR